VFEPEVLNNADDIPAFLELIQVMDRITDKRAVNEKLGRGRSNAKSKTRIHERINIGSVIAAALFGEYGWTTISYRAVACQDPQGPCRVSAPSDTWCYVGGGLVVVAPPVLALVRPRGGCGPAWAA
jgi:hypothetical protein